jgi:hypothetical protein
MPTDDWIVSLPTNLDELERLLSECPDEDEAMLLSQVDGYIARVLVDPHPVSQETWPPRIWGGSAEAFPSDPARSARLAALDARIAELEASRTALERLRARCASGRKGPCPIIDAFDGL